MARASRRADTEHKLGIWAGSTGELFFENVEVPAENLARRGGPGLRDRDVRARPGPLHGRGRRLRRHPRLPRALGRVRARAGDLREADRQVPVRPGHDRGDGARLRDVEAPRHAGRLAQGQGRAEHPRDAASRSGTRPSRRSGGAPRDPGARRVRLLGGVRHRAVLPQRPRADHLRGHDADPQDDAGRARARLPGPERHATATSRRSRAGAPALLAR